MANRLGEACVQKRYTTGNVEEPVYTTAQTEPLSVGGGGLIRGTEQDTLQAPSQHCSNTIEGL